MFTVALWPVPEFAVTAAAVPAVLVSEKVAEVAPVTEAVTVYGPPAVPFAVTVAFATPEAFVWALVATILAPLPGPAKFTVTPDTGLLNASCTVTESGLANAVFTVALWPVPEFAVTADAAPAVFVSENVAEVAPVTDAVTVYGPPDVVFAVTAALATPEAFVCALVATMPAPLPGPVKFTVTPDTGLPRESVTVTESGLANAVFTAALWPVPELAVTVAGALALFVSEKFADVPKPLTVADTV